MLIFLVLAIQFIDCKFLSEFTETEEFDHQNWLEDKNQDYENPQTDVNEYLYDMSVKAASPTNNKEKETDPMLGPHFLVLSESGTTINRQGEHPASNGLTRRRGVMEGIVGALRTTR